MDQAKDREEFIQPKTLANVICRAQLVKKAYEGESVKAAQSRSRTGWWHFQALPWSVTAVSEGQMAQNGA